jgi:hypothetical protein
MQRAAAATTDRREQTTNPFLLDSIRRRTFAVLPN